MKKKILIVEDDLDTQFVLKIISEELNTTVEISNSILTVSEVLTISPDLILLDNWLGDELGINFCLTLKHNPVTNHIPIIMLSANYDLQEYAKEKCADDFMSKPFDITELQTLMLSYLN